MRKLLMTLHRWLGFPLGILFVVTFGTGCITAFDELIERFEHTDYIEHSDHAKKTHFTSINTLQQTSIGEQALMISRILEIQNNISSIYLPTENKPYYRVFSKDEIRSYAIDDVTKFNYKKPNRDGFFHTVLQLHRNFLLGKEGLWGVDGKHFSAWVGLVALLLGFLGLWIWWPLKKTFNAKDIVPRGKKRKHFYYSHMTSGVITLIALILFSLTGASITYRTITKNLLNIDSYSETGFSVITLENSWLAWLEAAYGQMPTGAQLAAIRFPRTSMTSIPLSTEHSTKDELKGKSSQILSFRFITLADWFEIAQSEVKIDRVDSTLLEVNRFEDFSLNQKIFSVLVPLHTGKNLPVVYILILLVLSLIGTIMVFSGLASFVVKHCKRPKRSV